MIAPTQAELKSKPKRWLITGVAGFIGSNILEKLLEMNQHVVGLDNFVTGHRTNLENVKRKVGAKAWSLFTFYEGDIRDMSACMRVCEGVDYVLHQAALGSVPRSIEDPVRTNHVNVGGFLNMLVGARKTGVERFVYASSSSVYGDEPSLPKVEEKIGSPLSPYAVSKYTDEIYARVFHTTYGLQSIGLRYFNVFGMRQDPDGPYAAVIPRWIITFLQGGQPVINGDGKTSRDFCYIANVIQANILAATVDNSEALNKVYNIAYGEQTTLNQLVKLIKHNLIPYKREIERIEPKYGPFRKGDVRHSLADISKARNLLGYDPEHDVNGGLKESIKWYIENLISKKLASHKSLQ